MSTRLLASFLLTIVVDVGIAQTAQAFQPHAAKLTRRLQDQHTTLLFQRPLTISGELSIESEFRGDFTLRDTASDDLFQFEQAAELELFYTLTPHISVFLQGKASYQADFDAAHGKRITNRVLERGESWLYVGDLWNSGLSLQIGRQRFREEREWWWDEDVDAVRLHYTQPLWYAELAVAQELFPFSTEHNGLEPEDQAVLRFFGHTAWNWAFGQRFETFFLHHRDHSRRHAIGQQIRQDREDERDASLTWLGARASGEVDFSKWGEVDYSLQGAWVGGKEHLYEFDENTQDNNHVVSRLRRRVSGWAIDTSFTWTLPLSWEPRLTVAYAFGSGDRKPDQGTSQSFQQTGLQDNNSKFRGVNSFRYYGELFRPELSNLHIWTTALGFPFIDKSSIEIVYHFYQQVHPTPFLRDTRLKAKPQGQHRTIGQEWDIVMGLEEWESIEVELVGALFRAGRAFGPLSGELAQGVFLNIEYNF